MANDVSHLTQGTRSVVERHWQALLDGDLTAVMTDYSDDAVIITGVAGVSSGKEAIESLFSAFMKDILPSKSTKFSLDKAEYFGEVGLLVFSAESPTHRIPFATDTFVVRNGRIKVQTSAGQLLAK